MEIKKIEILAFAQGSADCICITLNDEINLLVDCGS